jgi:hypothetical protein
VSRIELTAARQISELAGGSCEGGIPHWQPATRIWHCLHPPTLRRREQRLTGYFNVPGSQTTRVPFRSRQRANLWKPSCSTDEIRFRLALASQSSVPRRGVGGAGSYIVHPATNIQHPASGIQSARAGAHHSPVAPCAAVAWLPRERGPPPGTLPGRRAIGHRFGQDTLRFGKVVHLDHGDVRRLRSRRL